jgi:hypothetical protein
MKKMFYVILSLFTLLIFGCSSPSVEVIKAEFAEGIYLSGGQPIVLEGVKTLLSIGNKGMLCSFEDHNIIKISLNFNYKALNTKEKIGSDEYRSEVYNILSKNAHFYSGEIEIKSVWGFWPEKVTEKSASDMELFYVIPCKTDLKKLRFEYDASQLGRDTGIYTYTKFSNMKPLKPKKQ